MTDTAPETPATDAPAQEPTADEPQQKVDEIDWKAKAREWEKVAKQNKNAAIRLQEIEDENKSELQKATDRLAAIERERDQARIEGLRFKVAVQHGISEKHAALYLLGSDEATLTEQAEGLAKLREELAAEREELAAAQKKRGNHVPREGATTTASENDGIQAIRGLFGGGSN